MKHVKLNKEIIPSVRVMGPQSSSLTRKLRLFGVPRLNPNFQNTSRTAEPQMPFGTKHLIIKNEPHMEQSYKTWIGICSIHTEGNHFYICRMRRLYLLALHYKELIIRKLNISNVCLNIQAKPRKSGASCFSQMIWTYTSFTEKLSNISLFYKQSKAIPQ